MDSITFTTGKRSYFLLLVGAFEIESRDVTARIYTFAPHIQVFVATGNLFIHSGIRVKVVSILIDISHFYGGSDSQFTTIRHVLFSEHAE